MCNLLRILFALICLAGFPRSVRAAAFDLNFLASGVSVGRGSFGVPDADLSQPDVTGDEFTSFDLMAGGHTYTLSDLFNADYIPSTNSFEFGFVSPTIGFYIVGNRVLTPVSDSFSFVVEGSYFDPCYFEGLCGPGDLPVFAGYAVSTIDAAGNQDYVANFDTFLITPAALPEPGAMALLLASAGWTGLLARKPRAAPDAGRPRDGAA